MVVQNRWEDCDIETRTKLTRAHQAFWNAVSVDTACWKEHNNKNTGKLMKVRGGIVKKVLNPNTNEPMKLYWHQFRFIYAMLTTNCSVPFPERKVARLMAHCMGSGKTVTAGVASIATVWFTMPDPEQDFKALIVAPKSVVRTWFQTVSEWLRFSGDEVFMPEQQDQITMDALEKARIVIVSPGLVCACAHTFEYLKREVINTSIHGKEVIKKTYEPGLLPGSARMTKWTDSGHSETELPPTHPLFLMSERSGWSVVINDEIDQYTNRNSQQGHYVAKLNASAHYTIGCGATPAPTNPAQMADCARLLNVQPATYQQVINWAPKTGKQTRLNRTTIEMAHARWIDRVPKSCLDFKNVRRVIVNFDPHVALQADGSFLMEAINAHNKQLNDATAEAMQMMTAADTGGDATYRSYMNNKLWSYLMRMTQMCFHYRLGQESAKMLQDTVGGPQLLRQCVDQPSQTMILIHRYIRDRQSKGDTRITIYSDSVAILEIMREYCISKKDCGRTFFFDGSLNAKQREQVTKEFLCDEQTPRGVLFLSSAGRTGLNICRKDGKGNCRTMFVIGQFPWNPDWLDQSEARIHRIDQPDECEIIRFVPSRSPLAAVLLSHEDKGDRMTPAILDLSKEPWRFRRDADIWKENCSVTDNLAPLDMNGNYMLSRRLADMLENWEARRDEAEAANLAIPPKPAELEIEHLGMPEVQPLVPMAFPKLDFVEKPFTPSFDSFVGKKRKIEDNPPAPEPVENEYDSLDDEEEVAFFRSIGGSESVQQQIERMRNAMGEAPANEDSDDDL